MGTSAARLRAWARRRLAALRASERGMTLVEILVAITIMGIAVPGLIASLGTASMASDRHRKQATADTILKSYGEAIKDTIRRNPATYVDCAPKSAYATPLDWNTPGGYQLPAGYTVSVTQVQYLDSAGWQIEGFCKTEQPWVNTQRLTLQALSADGRATETLEIVVRKP